MMLNYKKLIEKIASAKKTIVFDFDGVIHSYISGWKGTTNIPDKPVEGIKEAIDKLRQDYKIVVVSTRCFQKGGIDAIKKWLEKYDIKVDGVAKEKPPAIMYVDDNAVCFDGNPKHLIEQIGKFNNWMNKEANMNYKEQIEKIACEKLAESSYMKDFVSGFDPTGVSTFRNSLQNEKHHKIHKAVGDASGFISGAATGALMPAAMTGAAALAVRKKMPGLSHNLMNMAKGSMDSFNPKRVMKYTKSLGKLSEFQGLGGDLMRESNKTMGGVDKAEQLFNAAKKGKRLSKKEQEEALNHMKGMADSGKRVRDINSKLQDVGEDLSKNYYGGKKVSEGGERALTALTTLGTGVAGGALNASSSHMQYNTGMKTKSMLDEQKKKR